EPALADLLPPARFVQGHDEVRGVGLEIGGRIVEGEVAVLADADERDVDRRGCELASDLAGDARRVVLAVEPMRARDAGLADQPLEQVLAEACRMIDR